METPLTERAIARTYPHRSYTDPWEAIEDYERVMEYAAEHPSAGRVRVGNALDLPPSRVRGWLDGGKPNCMRAVEVGRERGWFDAELESDVFEAFNVLVASILTGGTISGRDKTVSFLASKGEPVLHALDTVRIPWRTRHADNDARPTEIVPSKHNSILARALTVLGAPHGGKNSATYYLPPYLSGAPDEVRLTFARIYLENRATPTRDMISLREEHHPETYIRQLCEFFERTLDAEVERDGSDLYIRTGAEGELPADHRPPKLQ